MKNYHGKNKSLMKNKRSKILFTALIFILITTLLATGCSSSTTDNDYISETQETETAIGRSYDSYQENVEDGAISPKFAEESYNIEQAEATQAPSKDAIAEKSTVQRKLIKNGNMEIRSDDVEASYQNVVNLVDKYKGFNTHLNRSQTDAMLNIYAVFGIPAEKLDQFVEDINQSEIVEYINITADDITDSYFDTTIRLQTSEKSLERYYEFLADAKKIEDMVYIQGQIDRLTQDIELLKGTLNRWDSQIDYSYISIEFNQKEAPVSGRREIEFKSMSWDDFKYWVNSGWNSVFSTIVSIFQWLAIAILVAGPIIIPILLIVFLILFLLKRRKRNRLKKQQEEGIMANDESIDIDPETDQNNHTDNQ